MSEVLNEYIIKYLRGKYGDNLYAVIAYGSRVAGYAIESSDYDFIVVIRNFRDKIRYIYEKIMDDTYVSLLIVDKVFFEEDVLEGKHGEFVSGRLYNVFIPLLNREYIEKMEIILKSRAILEELCILKSFYGELINYLIIPLKYILFARLKKRMMAYPPVKYSYYKTYYGPKGYENLNKSLDGFKKAAMVLDEEGLIKLNDNYIRVGQDGKYTCDFKEIIRILSRGFKMYITHGRSARVDLKVVVDEVASKVKRSLEGIRMPLELREPETLLKLDKGILISTRQPLEEVIRAFKGSAATVVSKKRKHIFSELYLLEISKDQHHDKLVLKKYSYLFFVKWIFIFLWLIGLKRFTISPKKRLINEYRGYIELKEIGIFVPNIFAVLWKEHSMMIEYLDGVTVNSLNEDEIDKIYYEIGKIIGKVHRLKGVSIGDTKPNNIIYFNGSVYIVDLEQYGLDQNFGWDIGEFIYYSNTFWNLKRNYLEALESFLRGYRDSLLDYKKLKEVLGYVTKIRFIIAFLPFVPINRLINIRRFIKNYLRDVSTQ